MKQSPGKDASLERWWPTVATLDSGQISMVWLLDLESRYREDGTFTKPIDLNYLDVRVQIHWLSERKCSLECRAPESRWKELHDAGYRGVLAVDRYAGHVTAISGVDRSVWWLAVFSAYGVAGGPQRYDRTELMTAASADDVRLLEELLAKGPDLQETDMIGVTALSCAAQSGSLGAFKLLLAKGADPTTITSGGGTLLHDAAAGGNLEIISVLLKAGLDINAHAQTGNTPLGWAILTRNADAAACLLRAGADPAAERGIRLCDEARLRFGADHPVTLALCTSH